MKKNEMCKMRGAIERVERSRANSQSVCQKVLKIDKIDIAAAAPID